MDPAIKVLYSFWTVSGRIFAVLQCDGGRLAFDSRLASTSGDEWTIIDNNVKVGPKDTQLLKLSETDLIFLLELHAIGDISKPTIGEFLILIQAIP